MPLRNTSKGGPDQVLTLMEWENEETKAAFSRYVMGEYPEKDSENLVKEIDQWISRYIDD